MVIIRSAIMTVLHGHYNVGLQPWPIPALCAQQLLTLDVLGLARVMDSQTHHRSQNSSQAARSLSAAASQFGKVGDPVAAVSSVALSAAARASRGPSSRSDTTPVYYIRDSLYKMIIQGGVRMTLTSAPSAGRTLRGLGLLADTLHQAQAGPARSPRRGDQRRLTPMASM